MIVDEMMSRDVSTISPETRFRDLLCRRLDGPSRQIYVTDEAGLFLGVITDYDFLKLMVPSYLDANLAKAVTADEAVFRRRFDDSRTLTAGQVMTADCAVLRLGDTLLEADAIFKERRHTALPVLDQAGRLVGEITRRAIIAYLVRLCDSEDSCQRRS